jgi:hypothetical protein
MDFILIGQKKSWDVGSGLTVLLHVPTAPGQSPKSK